MNHHSDKDTTSAEEFIRLSKDRLQKGEFSKQIETTTVWDEQGYSWVVPISVYSRLDFPVNSSSIMKELANYYKRIN